MNGLSDFFRAVLAHWGWLAIAAIASLLYAKLDFEHSNALRITLFLVALGSLFIALYLASADQYRAFSEYLKPSGLTH